MILRVILFPIITAPLSKAWRDVLWATLDTKVPIKWQFLWEGGGYTNGLVVQRLLFRTTRNCIWRWFNMSIQLCQQSEGCQFKPLKGDSCAGEFSPISLFCPWAMYFLLQGYGTCSKHTDVIWIRKHLPKPSFGGRVVGFNPKVIFQTPGGLIHEPESC